MLKLLVQFLIIQGELKMPYHCWGDDWEHWAELCKAESWICKMFERIRHKHIYSKEKYGTIRYEYTWMWLENDDDWLVFKKIIRKAVRKFPNVAGEIVDDLAGLASGYFGAWCAGVLWVTSGNCWRNNKGVKGFCHEESSKNNESWI